MTSLSRYLEEAAFSISISSSVFIFLWLFSRCIMDIVSSIVFISCPSLRTRSENLEFPSAHNLIPSPHIYIASVIKSRRFEVDGTFNLNGRWQERFEINIFTYSKNISIL